MKKKVLAVLMAFAMLTASFGGSLKYEAAARLTNLVTASAAEQNTIKTKFNKKLLFADDAAFEAEVKRLNDELIPQYKKAAEKLDSVDDVAGWLELFDGCWNSIGPVEIYGIAGVYLDGSDSTAIEQYNSVENLADDFNQITSSAFELLKSKDETFLNSLLTDKKLENWNDMLSSIINSDLLPKDVQYLLDPAEKAESSYEEIYNTLIDTDLQYEKVMLPDGSMIEANPVNLNIAVADTQNREYRRNMILAYYKSLKNYENTFAGLLDSYIVTSESLAKRYGYSSVLEMMAVSEGITPEIIENLIKSAHDNIDINSRLANIEVKAVGYDTEDSNVSNEPIYDVNEEGYKFENARDILTKALAPLGDEYIAVINKAFDEGWIDVYPDENKFSGCITLGNCGSNPCVIVNYTDDYTSLRNLAHELGHAVHYYMSDSNQAECYNALPTSFTSEIASLTNELLLTKYMENNAKTDKERLYFLLQEYEIYNTNFFATLADSDFEYQIRNIVNDGGVLAADTLDKLYVEMLDEYFPTNTKFEDREVGWIPVTQFYTPYYNKSYGFAVTAACTASDKLLSGNEKNIENYITFLKAGSTRSTGELYALTGTNLSDPSFAKPLIDRCYEIANESDAIISKYAGK